MIRAQTRFLALRDFTVEGGQAELERQAQKRKELMEHPEMAPNRSRENSLDGQRSPGGNRVSSLSNVPEDTGAFAIGDDESDEDEAKPTPAASSIQSASGSRNASMSADDAVPFQMRGMSEKARGKLPAGQSSFSRVSSNASMNNFMSSAITPQGNFEPNMAWVCSDLTELSSSNVSRLKRGILNCLFKRF